MGDTLLQRTIDSAREFVTGKPKKRKGIDRSYPVGHFASDEPLRLARLPTNQRKHQMTVDSYDKAMGKGALRREVRAGRDPIVPGPGGYLPQAGEKAGLSKGGFYNVMMDGAGQPIGPARTYATPATHWAPRNPMHREEYLTSQYDFRKSRGELLPPLREWLQTQTTTK